MSYHTRMLNLASKISRVRKDERRFCVGAVAERNDGCIVACANLSTRAQPMRENHAEFRLSGRLDRVRVVYVARTLAGGEWGLAKPCPSCRMALRARGVSTVYYTVGKGEYAVLSL